MDARAFNLIINDGRRPGHIKSLFIMAEACEINKPAGPGRAGPGRRAKSRRLLATAKFVA